MQNRRKSATIGTERGENVVPKNRSEWARRWEENAKRNEERKAERKREAELLGRVPKSYKIDVLKTTELYNALEEAAKDSNVQAGRYLRIAVIEKLQHEGYLPIDFKEDNRRKS